MTFDPHKMHYLFTTESSQGEIRAEVFQYASGKPKIKLYHIMSNKEVLIKNIPIYLIPQVEELFELISNEFSN